MGNETNSGRDVQRRLVRDRNDVTTGKGIRPPRQGIETPANRIPVRAWVMQRGSHSPVSWPEACRKKTHAWALRILKPCHTAATHPPFSRTQATLMPHELPVKVASGSQALLFRVEWFLNEFRVGRTRRISSGRMPCATFHGTESRHCQARVGSASLVLHRCLC